MGIYGVLKNWNVLFLDIKDCKVERFFKFFMCFGLWDNGVCWILCCIKMGFNNWFS